MRRNILWTGIEYHSLENLRIQPGDNSFHIQSSIIGFYEGKIYQVEYSVQTKRNWKTLLVDLRARIGEDHFQCNLRSDGNGDWTFNGRTENAFDGCFDIDIAVSPFTNTLPINRLQLRLGEQQTIHVIYIDVLGQKVTPLQQQYTRTATNKYRYQNVPNDFEAEIEVDAEGFVIFYPELFKRTHAVDSSPQ
jgi:uncharacterized protein